MRGNTISIKGNITRDAELRHTQNGNIVAAWGIAWNRSRKTEKGYEDVPHYFDVQCWLTDKQAQMVEPLLIKGARCAIIDGHLEYQAWESNGQKRSKVLISVDDPINGMLVEPSGNRGNQTEKWVEGESDKSPMDMYEDIPF